MTGSGIQSDDEAEAGSFFSLIGDMMIVAS